MAKVAFIGTGLLGSAMVEGMLRRGDTVTVWNRTEAKARALEAKGAKVAASASCPPLSLKAEKIPMSNEPITFTNKVPHGNLLSNRAATTPDIQNRATLPSAPPRAIQR